MMFILIFPMTGSTRGLHFLLFLFLTNCVFNSHKQPADVQTEPNFYNMAPSKNGQLMPRKDQTDLTIEFPPPTPPITAGPGETSFNSTSFADLSPGSIGVHGAAHLLKGMKSTNCSIKGRSLLDPPFLLGQSAMSYSFSSNESNLQQNNRTLSPTWSLSTTQSSNVTSSPIAITNNDLFVPKERSMSLLGRVQNFPKPLKMRSSPGIIDASSAFFWPPRKTTIGSPSHTAATF